MAIFEYWIRAQSACCNATNIEMYTIIKQYTHTIVHTKAYGLFANQLRPKLRIDGTLW